MSVGLGVTEKTDTILHGLKQIPFCDYKISFDGGITYHAPTRAQTTSGTQRQYVNAYMDKNNLYIQYSTNTAGLAAFTLYIDYVLYVTEVL
jgi:hypothetical protein